MFTRPKTQVAFLIGATIGWNQAADPENFQNSTSFYILTMSAIMTILFSRNNDAIFSSRLKNMNAIVLGLVIGGLLYNVSHELNDRFRPSLKY